MFADTILGIGRTSIFESAVDSEIEAISIDTVEECAGDPFEFATGIYYEAQMDMMKVNQAIMVCEYAYLKETGEELVCEANILKNLWDSVKKTAKKVWAKICQFFKKIFRWLSNTVQTDAQWVKAQDEKIKDMSDSSVTIDLEVYDYFANIGGLKPDFSTPFSPIKDAANQGSTHLFGVIIDDKTFVKANSMTEKLSKKLLDECRGKIVGKSTGVKAEDFDAEMNKYFRGDKQTKSSVSKNELKEMIDIVRDGNITKRSLDTAYALCKNCVDGVMKSATNAEKDANELLKRKDNAANQKASKASHETVTYLNGCLSLTTQVNSKLTSLLTSQNRQCKAVVSAALSKSKDSKKKSKTNESATVDSVFESFGL